jgi:hypothetical protein
MSITREQVLHVARLARLEIPEGEVEAVQAEVSAIGTPAPVSFATWRYAWSSPSRSSIARA